MNFIQTDQWCQLSWGVLISGLIFGLRGSQKFGKKTSKPDVSEVPRRSKEDFFWAAASHRLQSLFTPPLKKKLLKDDRENIRTTVFPKGPFLIVFMVFSWISIRDMVPVSLILHLVYTLKHFWTLKHPLSFSHIVPPALIYLFIYIFLKELHCICL